MNRYRWIDECEANLDKGSLYEAEHLRCSDRKRPNPFIERLDNLRVQLIALDDRISELSQEINVKLNILVERGNNRQDIPIVFGNHRSIVKKWIFPTASDTRECMECGRKIDKGEEYCKYVGTHNSNNICMECFVIAAAKEKLRNEIERVESVINRPEEDKDEQI